jgi:hypothetical protein
MNIYNGRGQVTMGEVKLQWAGSSPSVMSNFHQVLPGKGLELGLVSLCVRHCIAPTTEPLCLALVARCITLCVKLHCPNYRTSVPGVGGTVYHSVCDTALP